MTLFVQVNSKWRLGTGFLSRSGMEEISQQGEDIMRVLRRGSLRTLSSSEENGDLLNE